MNLLFLGGGLWVIPLLTAIGAVIFLVQAARGAKSGSKQQLPGGRTAYSDENVPIYKSGRFWFGIALAVATVVIFFMMRADR